MLRFDKILNGYMVTFTLLCTCVLEIFHNQIIMKNINGRDKNIH